MAWVSSVNEQLDRMLVAMTSAHITQSAPPLVSREWSPGRIRVFGRVAIQQKKFNAETDVTHRRVDYCFPASLLFISSREGSSHTALRSRATTLQEFCDSLPSFQPGSKACLASINGPYNNRPDEKTLSYLHEMKQIMKRISTQVEELNDCDAAAVLEKDFHDAKRKKKKQTNKGNRSEIVTSNTTSNTDESTPVRPHSSKRLLKRKRYHNFCPRILAHDFLAYRRVDRIFHRATIRLEGISDTDNVESPTLSSTDAKNRPFIVISLTGDLFLQEQVVRLIGLLIAICRGVSLLIKGS
jgi:tRNA U38,U39,U40 pseudouridine synthase TruA